MIWFDAYDRKARLIPGLLALLPVAIVIIALGLRQQPVVAGIAGLLTAVGLPVLLTSTVRAWGLKLQDELYAKWGGAPTTECLRYRGAVEDAARREQWRKNVIRVVAHSLPTRTEEEVDELVADGRYRAAIDDVIEQTRGKFPLVFEENKNYGFERNLLAMRPIGLVVAGSAVVVAASALMAQVLWGVGLSTGSVAIGLIAVLAVLVVWLFVPGEGRVHRVGRRYAERLLDSLTKV